VQLVSDPPSQQRTASTTRADDRKIPSRLLTLAQARDYCGGKHPSELGIAPMLGSGKGARYDRRLIDACMDQRSGLNSQSNEFDDDEISIQMEQAALERNIAVSKRS